MSDLRTTHTTEIESGNTGKIIAAVIVALVIGGVGIYSYDTGMWKTSVVSDKQLPSGLF